LDLQLRGYRPGESVTQAGRTRDAMLGSDLTASPHHRSNLARRPAWSRLQTRL